MATFIPQCLSQEHLDFILSLPEVLSAKERLQTLSVSSVYFTVVLTPQIKTHLLEVMGLDLYHVDNIPMRWIQGDTVPHVDVGSHSFDKTYLAYLTDCPGDLLIDNQSFPISKGCGYVFSEGLFHETIGTGQTPRLLLGPMSEQGSTVGGFSIEADGATETVYLRYNPDLTINEYKINNGSWSPLYLTAAVANTNADPTNNLLKFIFTTDLVLVNSYDYFICASDGIQFGSTSLNSDGTRPKILVNNVENYYGFIKNGDFSGNGNAFIYVYNLEVRSIGSFLINDAGWIGQAYFGIRSNNYIVNCFSDGDIPDNGGGIVGQYAGRGNGVKTSSYVLLTIRACSSQGNIGNAAGGIVGDNAGADGGWVSCEQCWQEGSISGNDAGGIYGKNAASAGSTIGGRALATQCYSLGAISGQNAGGIFGQLAGTSAYCYAENCYAQGSIIGIDAGGIFGNGAASDGGTTVATNCYSSQAYIGDNGIYSGGSGFGRNQYSCYAANGNWNNLTANTQLDGVPISNPVVGTVWVAFGGLNHPYELNAMGYTPYYSLNISSAATLIQTFNQTVLSGQNTPPAIRVGASYTKLHVTGGNPGSYDSITVNNSTGVISTTSSTSPGVYTITIRNTGSYNTTLYVLTVIGSIIPNVPICFPAGTLVLTDQGEVSIEKIRKEVHTILGKEIVAVTESIPLDSYLICIEKDSFAPNVPNRKTLISKDHKIKYCGSGSGSGSGVAMVPAELLTFSHSTIYKIPYHKQTLYNVLLNEHSIMSVHNLTVETLHPNNYLAKIYAGQFSANQRNELVKRLNRHVLHKYSCAMLNNKLQQITQMPQMPQMPQMIYEPIGGQCGS